MSFFGPFFGTKRWIIFERKKISKIANKLLEKRQRRGSVPNFKTRALAVWKLKGKENCENEHRETASFMYNFVQKTNATVQLWWHFKPTSLLNFFTRFSPEDPLKGTLRDQKVIFVKSPISSPIVIYDLPTDLLRVQDPFFFRGRRPIFRQETSMAWHGLFLCGRSSLKIKKDWVATWKKPEGSNKLKRVAALLWLAGALEWTSTS